MFYFRSLFIERVIKLTRGAWRARRKNARQTIANPASATTVRAMGRIGKLWVVAATGGFVAGAFAFTVLVGAGVAATGGGLVGGASTRVGLGGTIAGGLVIAGSGMLVSVTVWFDVLAGFDSGGTVRSTGGGVTTLVGGALVGGGAIGGGFGGNTGNSMGQGGVLTLKPTNSPLTARRTVINGMDWRLCSSALALNASEICASNGVPFGETLPSETSSTVSFSESAATVFNWAITGSHRGCLL